MKLEDLKESGGLYSLQKIILNEMSILHERGEIESERGEAIASLAKQYVAIEGLLRDDL